MKIFEFQIEFHVYVPWGLTDNMSAPIPIMAWRRSSNKLLYVPMLTYFTDAYMRHKGRWVKWSSVRDRHYTIPPPQRHCSDRTWASQTTGNSDVCLADLTHDYRHSWCGFYSQRATNYAIMPNVGLTKKGRCDDVSVKQGREKLTFTIIVHWKQGNSNYTHYTVWDKIIYPFQNSMVAPLKFGNGWVISHFTVHVITYSF